MRKNMKVKTKEEARQIAIDWQDWASKQNMDFLELSHWLYYLEKLAKKFNLIREFKENGII